MHWIFVQIAHVLFSLIGFQVHDKIWKHLTYRTPFLSLTVAKLGLSTINNRPDFLAYTVYHRHFCVQFGWLIKKTYAEDRSRSISHKRPHTGLFFSWNVRANKISNEFFTLRNQPHLRGHKYVINKQRCSNNRRINFFSNRIVNIWNNLPSSTTDFTSFRKFDESLNNDYLLLYCKLNFI